MKRAADAIDNVAKVAKVEEDEKDEVVTLDDVSSTQTCEDATTTTTLDEVRKNILGGTIKWEIFQNTLKNALPDQPAVFEDLIFKAKDLIEMIERIANTQASYRADQVILH